MIQKKQMIQMIQKTTANDPKKQMIQKTTANDPKKQIAKIKQRTIYRYFMWEN